MNNVHGTSCSQSLKRLLPFLPKKYVSKNIKINGIKIPANKSNCVTFCPTAFKKLVCPFTLLNPTVSGVPTAPNETAVESATNASVTAAIGVNPKAIINGAVTMAGVPNPETPSINPPKRYATNITCIRISAERL